MQLQNGRPENTDGRLDKEIRIYDFLDKQCGIRNKDILLGSLCFEVSAK